MAFRSRRSILRTACCGSVRWSSCRSCSNGGGCTRPLGPEVQERCVRTLCSGTWWAAPWACAAS
eukprot:205969-Heterocapsa_arctica.AAC.1